ncbi:MAG: hypothetical protein OXE99_12465 [Cellvibrionales bacterium]|nr:hypothetical protein [Cellvibrionales bacterium]
MRLAIIITSYNRHKSITNFIERITILSQSKAIETHQIHVFIINNGKPLPLKDTDIVSIIPNRNLGGSGGFARGMYEASKDSTITHCLFMDDDANTNINTLINTIDTIKHTSNDCLSIVGNMINKCEPLAVYEAGAKIKFFGLKSCPIKQNLHPQNIDYGGWWFYAFPLSYTFHYPFPFFIRYDDILFGLMNKYHHKQTFKNISCTQPAFNTKFCPFLHYLLTRNKFIVASYLAPIRASIFLRLFFLHQVIYFTFCYRYESAQAVIEGFKDGLKGTQFWVDNIECIEPKARIDQLTRHERYDMDFDNLSTQPIEELHHKADSWPMKIVRALTFNGHLLPRFLLSNALIKTTGRHKYPTRMVFLRKRILYQSPNNEKVMMLNHSKKQCFTILGSACWLLLKTSFSLHRLLQQYQKDIPYLTSEAFWESQFEKVEGFVKKPKGNGSLRHHEIEQGK